METWLDVRPLRIPRPKLLSSGSESSREIRTLLTHDMIDDSHLSEAVRPKSEKDSSK